MEIHEPHGQRFQIALELLHEGKFFVFDGVRFSLSDQQLVVAIESSFWPNVSEPTACADLHRARNIAEYLAKESAEFASIYQNHQHFFLLLNYYGHGGEIEAARMVQGRVVWAKGMPQARGAAQIVGRERRELLS